MWQTLGVEDGKKEASQMTFQIVIEKYKYSHQDHQVKGILRRCIPDKENNLGKKHEDMKEKNMEEC